MKSKINNKLHNITYILISSCFGATVVIVLAFASHSAQPAHADSINTTDFVTTWRVEAGDTSITVPTQGTGYNYNVDWNNDGTPDETGITGDATHDFGAAGDYTIRISGDFPQIYNDEGWPYNNSKKLIDVNQWGTNQWRSMEGAFARTSLSTLSATDVPDLSNVTSMSSMFKGVSDFNSDISSWDVSNVTNMSEALASTRLFNQDLSDWNVSSVTDMSGIFYGSTDFNQDISDWDVSNVTDMSDMFNYAINFSGDLSSWNTAKVIDMGYMFSGASSFNSDISNWDVSNVTNMSGMFRYARNFSGNLSSWDVSNVTNMSEMFADTDFFNQDISDWDVSSVTDMSGIFSNAINFSGDLSSWDTSSVVNMKSMFEGASSFNSNISNWDTSRVKNMAMMFSGYSPPSFAPGGSSLSSFNQPLGEWDVSQVESMYGMFNSSNLSTANYDATLRGWSQQSLQPDVELGAEGLTFCDAGARQSLIDNHNWEIHGDSQASGCSPSNVTVSGKTTVTLLKTNSAGDKLGQLAAAGDSPITFAIACTNPAQHDSLFTIDANNNLVTTSHLNYIPGAPNAYSVCVSATNSSGSTEQIITVVVTEHLEPPYITDVTFKTDSDSTTMQITGVGFNPSEDSDLEYFSAIVMIKSLVTLNGNQLPFCTKGMGVTAEEVIARLGIDPALVSDEAPCYLLGEFDGEGQLTLSLTDNSAVVLLPSDFDIIAQGTVSVNGTPDFIFNYKPANPTAALKENGQVVAITGNPTIPANPTFTGTAEPFAAVTVTVRSDPVTCTTTASANGSWSCTLPQSLPAGSHTVYVNVTLVGGSTQELGPYPVTVADDGTSLPVTNETTPGAPSTGIKDRVMSFVRESKGDVWLVAAGLVAAVIVVVGLKRLYQQRTSH